MSEPPADTPFGEVFAELRREYVAEGAARVAELRRDTEALRHGDTAAIESLRVQFHRLAGSGGSYGFPEIGAIGRETERWLAEEAARDADAAARVDDAISRLAVAFDRALAELGGP